MAFGMSSIFMFLERHDKRELCERVDFCGFAVKFAYLRCGEVGNFIVESREVEFSIGAHRGVCAIVKL